MTRIDVRYTAHGCRIIVRNQRWMRSALMVVWLLVWVPAGLATIDEIQSGRHLAFPALAFIAMWIAGWACGGVVMVWLILWQTLGSEEIVLDNDILTFATKVGIVLRTRSYPVAGIQNLRLETRRSRAKGHDFLVRVLAFDYEKTGVRLRIPLSRDEGDQILTGPLSRVLRRPE